tara:strand:- start:1612 stop:2652 length:1041 start_codon:yes stop_codon:yes gene_type:complete
MVKKLTMSSKALLIGVIFVFLVIFSLLFWPQNLNNYEKKIIIKSGFNLKKISNILFEESIVSSPKLFILATKLLGKEREIPVGAFTLVNANTNFSIIKQLVNGTPEIIKVQLIEGWNIKQMSIELNKTLGFDLSDLMNLSRNKTFLLKHNINANSIEGYLFPDTYKFFLGETPISVFNLLVDKHNDFWISAYELRAEELSLTKHEVITLASIIEGEAIFDSERARISGVYHNRLKLKMKLQADPTIQYIISDSPRRLLNRDLRIDSPYNTYMYKGLPPGPINSPGKKSLIAALYPEENNYIFFVARGDGFHTFTTNERQHNIAKKRFQSIRNKYRKKKNNAKTKIK